MHDEYVAILRINGPMGTAREAAREDVGGILESMRTRIEGLGMKILVHSVEGDCDEFPPAEKGVVIASPYFELVSPEAGLENISAGGVENDVERRRELLHKIAERLAQITGLPVFKSVYREVVPYDSEQEPEEID